MRCMHCFVAVGLCLFGALIARSAEQEAACYRLSPDEYGMVLATPDGRTVFRYMTKKPAETNLTANSVCCLYPVYTPKGERAVDFAPGDHRHHRGVFLAWHALSAGRKRADFWGWGHFAPTEGRVIENRSVELAEADAEHARLAVCNNWNVDGETAIEEKLSVEVREMRGVFIVDLDFQLAPTVDVQLDETAFGGFCVKGRKDGQPKYVGPDGPVTLPRPHHLKPGTDWPAAAWYDYVLKLDGGGMIGVAVIDHPGNPQSLWHNLEPIAMLNPCIVAPGAVRIAKGKTLRLRYRLVVHDGPAPMALIRSLSKQWRGK